jgi:hypothetical protein
MTHRDSLKALTWAVACAGLLTFCAGGGKSAEAPAPPASEAATAPEGDQASAQAANDSVAAARSEGDAFDPATASGAVKGIPAPTNTAPIEAVANFFTELPGFDLASFDTARREKFLHRVNSELCSCGCKNDTLAHCLINDTKCPTVKGLVQVVYDEVKAGR